MEALRPEDQPAAVPAWRTIASGDDAVKIIVGQTYPLREAAQAHRDLEGTVPVYNLEVGGFHTFFVSKSQILVHNK